ncbi:MAG: hypothetical protein Q8M09_11840 [Pseudomonadota bacterium]|nr:hypothetical protein [Pseudomonadota bacterium]MDP1904921.1 hypothetical protein [Pseudomonadota bacterium]MDP2352044.1 hypothetical protein [Pseudomonadota bacterium]
MLDQQSEYCLRLWSEVVRQSIRDVEVGTEVERDAALEWMFNGNQGSKNCFDSVCSWLDINPDNARRQLLLRKRFHQRHDNWINAVSAHQSRKAA